MADDPKDDAQDNQSKDSWLSYVFDPLIWAFEFVAWCVIGIVRLVAAAITMVVSSCS